MATAAPTSSSERSDTTDATRVPRNRGERKEHAWVGYLRAALIVTGTTAVASFARRVLHVPDVEMLLLLAVVLSALTCGRGAALLAAGLAVVAYDFFFIPPEFAFTLANGRYMLTFAMMFGISVVMGSLMLRLREQQQAAVERERRTAALHALSAELAAAFDEAGIAHAVERAVSDAVGAEAVLLIVGRDGIRAVADPPRAGSLSDGERTVARWVADHALPAGWGTGVMANARILCIPLHRFAEDQAVLAVRSSGQRGPSREVRSLLDALARITAVALDRVRLSGEARREELRTGLLSSVSHDLRTPLAAITGAATALREGAALDADTKRELTEAIVEQAERLERLVSNVLDMMRLDQGAIAARREWVPADEIVGSALTHLEAQLAGHRIRTMLPPDLPLLSVDPVLLEQLFVNLLENAAKYTPRGTEIELAARCEGNELQFEVADRGPGIAPGDEERIFDRFYRGERAGSPGVGLGLSIARAIALVHGGRIVGENRPGGGALFRLTLPVPAEPPPIVKAAQDTGEWTVTRRRGDT